MRLSPHPSACQWINTCRFGIVGTKCLATHLMLFTMSYRVTWTHSRCVFGQFVDSSETVELANGIRYVVRHGLCGCVAIRSITRRTANKSTGIRSEDSESSRPQRSPKHIAIGAALPSASGARGSAIVEALSTTTHARHLCVPGI